MLMVSLSEAKLKLLRSESFSLKPRIGSVPLVECVCRLYLSKAHRLCYAVIPQAHPDPENRINKKAMSEHIPAASTQFSSIQSLTYSNMFANTPVMINWHSQHCQLTQIRPQWLVSVTPSPFHFNILY